MNDFSTWRFSLRQAIYLALTVLAVYFPITIYVNVPGDHIIEALRFLVLPAFITFIFYVVFILATDRAIDLIEEKFNTTLTTEFRLSTFLLSIPLAVFAMFLMTLIFRFILHPTSEEVSQMPFPQMTPEQFEIFQRTNNGLTLMTILAIFHLLVNRKINIRMKDMSVETERLNKENALAQFEALKNQVSPHFLFNSLSILSSLVRVDGELSAKFIDQLSKAYRYILEQKDKDSITLKTELEFVQSYAFLLKIRFQNKFDVKVSISDQDADRYQIAPLTLQLLIENAVKHNRMSTREPLEISINIENDHLVVSNAIRPRNENENIPSTGIGLRNIISRYSLLTRKPVVVSDIDGTFVVKIPLL